VGGPPRLRILSVVIPVAGSGGGGGPICVIQEKFDWNLDLIRLLLGKKNVGWGSR